VSITANSFFGLGEEVTAGTEAARTVWLRITSNSLMAAAEYVEVNNLAHTTGYATHGESIITKKKVGGAVSGFLSYRGMGLLLKHALGSLSSSGAGPYTHTYTHALALPAGLTGESVRGTSGNAEEHYGLRVSKLTLNMKANEIGTWEADFIGMGTQARAAGGTPSPSVPYRIVGHHLASSGFTFNSVTYKVRSIKLVIDNKLTEVAEMSSLYTSSPQRGDHSEFTVEVELYATVETLYNAHLAGTSAGFTAVFTEPSTSDTFTITLHNVTCVECADPLSGAGLISTRAVFKGHAGSSDSGCTIEVVNTQSSGIAA
jgi:hypothetical protein